MGLYNGTSGADSIVGSSGVDTIYGFDGNDTLKGGDLNDELYGGNGDDVLYANGVGTTDYFNLLDAGWRRRQRSHVRQHRLRLLHRRHRRGHHDRRRGRRLLTCGQRRRRGVVTEASGEGTDGIGTSLYSYTLPANVENGFVYGQSVGQYLTGNSLNNQLTGWQLDDVLSGGSGNDSIYGGGGYDMLYGDGGNDHIEIGSTGSLALGGTGSDVIIGGAGNDVLHGNYDGSGVISNDADTLTGGGGSDIFHFGAADWAYRGSVHNRVEDFAHGTDTLRLDDLQDAAGDMVRTISLTNVTDGGVASQKLVVDYYSTDMGVNYASVEVMLHGCTTFSTSTDLIFN